MRLFTLILTLFGATTAIGAPLEKIDPNQLLYTTPTINDAIPTALTETPLLPGGVATHEDNWRQFEFVSSSYKQQIEKELEHINEIWKFKSVKTGEYTAFRNVHVRKLIPSPISIPFTQSDFSALFGQKPASFAFLGSSHAFRDVHAIQSGGVAFYAEISDGKLSTLGIDSSSAPTLTKDTISRLATFIKKNKLVLVHWPSRTLLESPGAIVAYLNGK